MSIEELLRDMAARDEALAQSVKLLVAEGKLTDERIRALAIIAEQNEVRAGKMQEGLARMQDAIARLARIADIHEDRITDLENRDI